MAPVFDPEPLRGLDDDGLYLPEIKRHSLEKIRAHNYNVQIFSTAMKSRWPQRAYVGLYCGAGRARLSETGEVIETAAAAVCRLPDPFTHHVFVDKDPRCTAALDQRIRHLTPDVHCTVLTGDVNELVPQILRALPAFGREKGLLSYCFVDPFDAGLKFSTIRSLGQLKIDFLVLLMLGNDARRNFSAYFQDPTNTRIGDFIDAPYWREEWRQESASRRASVVRFLMRKFDEAMVRIGYMPALIEDALPVKVHNKGVLLYKLVYYSKHPLGQKLWKVTRAGIDSQLDLSL